MASLKPTAIDMPASLIHYWTMWNEPDLEKIRGHLNQAVAESVEWADPQHHHVGRDALEANARALRASKPEYRFLIASEIDAHHGRLRYKWHMVRKHRVLLRGLDIVSLDHATGLIDRVDGFFGETIDLQEENSGVPAFLRPSDEPDH